MIALDLPPRPAIIQAAEPWEIRLGNDLTRRGVSFSQRLAVVAEVRRLQSLSQRFLSKRILRPTLDDLARYAGDPRLAPTLGLIVGYSRSFFNPTLTFINSATTTNDSTTYNPGDFTAASDGVMIVIFGANGSNSRTVSSLSIGGTNGTLITGTTSVLKLAIGYRAVTAGAQTVTITLSATNGSNSSIGITVWLLTGYASATAHDSDAPASQTTVATVTATLDLPSGGIALFANVRNSTGATGWTSANDSNFETDVSSRHHAHAFIDPTATETNHAEAASWTGNQTARIVGASWA